MKTISSEESEEQYQKIFEIGGGTYGSVFKMYSTKEKKIIAMKIISNVKDLSKPIREAESLQELKHPNIVKFYDAFFVNEDFWIATEYCAGGSINALKSKMTEKILLCIIRDVLNALSFIHRQNKIHFDVKPPNILFSSIGEFKLADFGLTKDLCTLTKKTQFSKKGSELYMSPEMLQNNSNVSSAVDIWALGISAFEMMVGIPLTLTGKKTFQEWESKNLDHVFPGDNKPMSLSLKNIFCKMLIADPNKRATADQLLEEKCLKNLPESWLVCGNIICKPQSVWD